MKQIPFAKNYYLDQDGSIYSCFRNWNKRKLNPTVDYKAGGYKRLKVILDSGEKVSMFVHRLMALTYLDNPENKEEVNHIDGNKLNNKLSNLEWVTKKENMLHAHKLKLRDNTGEGNPRKVLNEEEVIEIYNKSYDGARVCDLADEYGVSRPTISDIKAKRNWSHILNDLPDIKHKPKKESLSENTVRWICSQIEKGIKLVEIVKNSNNENITVDKIYDIKRKKSFVWISKDYNF
jgi:hypothetical protein